MLTHRHFFLEHVAQTSTSPLMLEIESAEGIYMKDINGKEYVDIISGIGVSNIGHRHPNVIQAVEYQLKRYTHLMVYGEFIESPQTSLAKKLSDTLAPSLDNVYFVNSGSEANEGAIKLAKRYTNRGEIISFQNAYHGSTHGALSITGNEDLKSNYRPLLPGIKHLEFNNISQLEEINKRTAAVIVEVVQGEAGVRVADQEFISALRQKCDMEGTLLIIDEVQSGFGRTGKFWAHEHYGITPDIITCAKGMGGGFPVGAFISSKEIMSVLTHNPILGHITTFGGHPVSCAASIATLDTILKEGLSTEVDEKANLFRSLLQHDAIVEIRNKGLMMAVEFDSFALLEKIIQKALHNGILTDWFLFCDNSMRIAPPLIITEEEIRESCQKIIKSIDEALQ